MGGELALRGRRLRTHLQARRLRERATWASRIDVQFRRYDESRRPAFAQVGANQRRPFFAHRVYRIPRAGPDALMLSDWSCGVRDPARLWLFLLHAESPAVDVVDGATFFDRDLVWHAQHHGLPGHVAYACLAEVGRDLYGLTYVSDLVQRVGRRPEIRTRIDNTFRGWPWLLLNAILDFAVERGFRRLRSPTSERVLRYTDAARDTGGSLFGRIYDHPPERLLGARRRGGWWEIDVDRCRSRVVQGLPAVEPRSSAPVFCLCHDLEGGWGHRDLDPELAERMDRESPAAIERMLEEEARWGVRGTCCVVGEMLSRWRPAIERGGHALGIHSWDHDRTAPQLARCRVAAPDIRGYRPPRSEWTAELTSETVARYGYEWLAMSEHALGAPLPRLASGIARIPIALDDYPLHTGEASFDDWSRRPFERLRERGFVALGLHDAYAAHWLDRYGALLERLRDSGEPRTLSEVSAWLGLAAAR